MRLRLYCTDLYYKGFLKNLIVFDVCLSENQRGKKGKKEKKVVVFLSKEYFKYTF